MAFLFKWLRVERAERVTLHPTRTLDVAVTYEATFARCVDGIERVLGGVVRERDAARGTLEATFGLTFSERLTCALERVDAGRTRVRIDSRRGAVGEPRTQSDYVDRLADWLVSE